jgi:membrane protease YdiL (CAAX protease family)
MWTDKTKKPIWSFLALTFLIAWVFEGILIFVEQLDIIYGMVGFVAVTMYRGITVAFAPAWAMLILLKKHGQINGVKDFLFRIFKTENTFKTIVITAVFFIGQFVIVMLSGQFLGESWLFAFTALPWLVAGIIGGGMEEPGWRGFLQPALDEKFPFVLSALIVGLIWAVWHIPGWFVQSIGQSDINFLSFTIYCIGLSFVMAALYKLTKNVFAVILFHSWTNAIEGIYSMDIILTPPGFSLITIVAMQIIVSVAIYVFVDKNNSTDKHQQVKK